MTMVISKTTTMIKSKIDVAVYFKDSATTQEISDLQQIIAARPDVKEVRYISKEEALRVWNERQKNQRIKELIKPEENPLPRSLAIKATNPEDLKNIADFLAQNQYSPIVHKISYEDNKQIIDKLLAITSFVKKMGWIFSITFVIISILVILNTIRLTIFTRKEEIEIMRLVGASDRFIKVPFIVEGILYGFLACIVATIALWIVIGLATPLTNRYLGSIVTENMHHFFISKFLLIFLMQFIVGILVGIGCSLFSIRRYLKV
ncbi:MAG: Cell division protein FtsX [Candidatus Berkelbacteria bacterium]|nr:Cell division protein FtsX [Candidatus Berkelbacteria bacterium]